MGNIQTIAREFNVDEEAAEKWGVHTQTVVELEVTNNPDEVQLHYAEKDLLPYLDADDTITYYPGNPAEA